MLATFSEVLDQVALFFDWETGISPKLCMESAEYMKMFSNDHSNRLINGLSAYILHNSCIHGNVRVDQKRQHQNLLISEF